MARGTRHQLLFTPKPFTENFLDTRRRQGYTAHIPMNPQKPCQHGNLGFVLGILVPTLALAWAVPRSAHGGLNGLNPDQSGSGEFQVSTATTANPYEAFDRLRQALGMILTSPRFVGPGLLPVNQPGLKSGATPTNGIPSLPRFVGPGLLPVNQPVLEEPTSRAGGTASQRHFVGPGLLPVNQPVLRRGISANPFLNDTALLNPANSQNPDVPTQSSSAVQTSTSAASKSNCVFHMPAGPYASQVQAIQHEIDQQGAGWCADNTSMMAISPEKRNRRLGAILSSDVMARIAATKTARRAAIAKYLRGVSAVSGTSPAASSSSNSHSQEAPAVSPATSPSSYPASLDWRNNHGVNAVTPIKDQGSCGSCFIFGSVAALESQMLLRGFPSPNQSEEIAIACGVGTCGGGAPKTIANYIQNTGLPPEWDLPYSSWSGSESSGASGTMAQCSNAVSGWQADAVRISGYKELYPSSVADVKKALIQYGPLVTTMQVYSDFQAYSNGVYSYTSGSDEGGHVIEIIGYDDAAQAFIAKNSWGVYWGENGFFQIAYSELGGKTDFGAYDIAYLPVTSDSAGACLGSCGIPGTNCGQVAVNSCGPGFSPNPSAACTLGALPPNPNPVGSPIDIPGYHSTRSCSCQPSPVPPPGGMCSNPFVNGVNTILSDLNIGANDSMAGLNLGLSGLYQCFSGNDCAQTLGGDISGFFGGVASGAQSAGSAILSGAQTAGNDLVQGAESVGSWLGL